MTRLDPSVRDLREEQALKEYLMLDRPNSRASEVDRINICAAKMVAIPSFFCNVSPVI